MVHRSKLALITGCAAAAWLPVCADAATPSASGTTPDGEIVVTAQKKSELLKNVPASVTAVTATTLQDIGAARLEDYTSRIPALTVSNVSMATGSTQVTIRGITTGIGGNPTVGIYVDDSPFGSSSALGGYTVPDLDPQDLARVEVLRGPQGTLYGAGSLGGLLKYVTAAPDPSHVFGRLSAEGSTVDGGGQGYAVRGAVNIPLSDTLAIRVSGYDRQDPGFVDNILTGKTDANLTRYYGARIALGWQISPDWKVRLSALYQHQKGSGPIVDYDPTTFKPLYGDLKQSHAYNGDFNEQAIGAYSLTIEGNIGDFATLTSATAYDHQKLDFNADGTPIIGPVIAYYFGVPGAGAIETSASRVDKITEELRLASRGTGAVSWLIGGFYTHELTRSADGYDPEDPVTGAALSGIPLLGSASIDDRFEEEAVFGNLTYKFSDSFDITGGVRYSHNDQKDRSITAGLFLGTSDLTTPSSDSATTWLVNPRFHLTKDTMIYARIATGYRPGGPNIGGGAIGVPASFGPDRVTNYEIGLKSDLFDRKLSLDLSGYYIDWKNIQVQELSSGTGTSFITNGPAAVSKGFEAALSWRPMRGLQVYGNVAYQDARVSEDFPAGGAIAADGDRLPLVPLWSGALGADYTVPLTGAWKAQLGADWHHVGQTLGLFPNAGAVRFVHPAYDVVGLRLGVTDDRWTIMFYARNLGDDRGQTADYNFGTVSRVSVIQPRTFALSVAVNF
jgi:iron complex outermembrane recepter protein